MQTDDSLNCGNKTFEELEEAEARFLTKGREFLNEGSALRFNGATISRRMTVPVFPTPSKSPVCLPPLLASKEEFLEEHIS